MAQPEMKTVTFVKNFQTFFGGDNPDSAQFEVIFADKLIAAGIAVEYAYVAPVVEVEAKKAGKF